MNRWFFVVLLGLFSGSALAVDHVMWAKQGRDFLSEPGRQAGFEEKKVCPKPQKGKKKKPKCATELKSLDVLLAVRRENDKSFTLVEAAGSGPNLCVSKTAGFVTKCYVNHYGATNGVNTEFEIESPPGYRVYAIRRVVNNPGGRKEVVYTPYSDKLNLPEVRAAGEKYIDSVVNKAIAELRTLKATSLRDRSKLLADMVPRETITRLVLIEHIDEERFRKEPFAKLALEVYTTYGLNQTIAYNYAVSSAGARGMFQIIPKTYYAMIETCPLAKLKPSFVEGTRDHQNAAKAAMCLADHDVSLVPTKYRHLLAGKTLSEYVASSYNGGPSRPIKILKEGHDLVVHNLNSENRLYVMKMREALKKF